MRNLTNRQECVERAQPLDNADRNGAHRIWWTPLRAHSSAICAPLRRVLATPRDSPRQEAAPGTVGPRNRRGTKAQVRGKRAGVLDLCPRANAPAQPDPPFCSLERGNGAPCKRSRCGTPGSADGKATVAARALFSTRPRMREPGTARTSVSALRHRSFRIGLPDPTGHRHPARSRSDCRGSRREAAGIPPPLPRPSTQSSHRHAPSAAQSRGCLVPRSRCVGPRRRPPRAPGAQFVSAGSLTSRLMAWYW